MQNKEANLSHMLNNIDLDEHLEDEEEDLEAL